MQNFSHLIARIRAHDVTLWSDDATVREKIARRLGWTTLPEEAPKLYPLLDRLVALADERDITDIVLIGMGGSSLAPYVFSQTYGDQATRTLHVLDTTCPEDVMALARSLDFERTLFIVASKSGTTLETITLEELFWHLVGHSIEDEAARATHFIAITDDATPLSLRAQERGYTLVTSPLDVGGRFSVLSVFGLVPAALIGIDCRAIVTEAIQAQRRCESPDEQNPAILLAAELWDHLESGFDKLPLPDLPLSMWLEQLIAESLGKDGKGIVPFTRPLTCCCSGPIMPCPDSSRGSRDSVLAQYGGLQGCCLKESSATEEISVAEAMVVWQWAVALLGVCLDVNPFDQPNVATAKASILRVLERPDMHELEATERHASQSVDRLLDEAESCDYVCILAYVNNAEFQQLKEQYVPALATKTKLPISLVQGPRYLHSIGQLHEGGPNTGIFIMIDNASADAPNVMLPHLNYTLREFFDAQRVGDILALRSCDRRVATLNINEL